MDAWIWCKITNEARMDAWIWCKITNTVIPCDIMDYMAWRASEPFANQVAVWNKDDVKVSTIFNGRGPSEEPWETMVFGDLRGIGLSEWMDRYTTYDEAVEGHHRMVELVVAAMQKEGVK
jgi:hypothetical protein